MTRDDEAVAVDDMDNRLTADQRQRLGRLLRGLRMSRGLTTQIALSEQAEVSTLTIRRLESGQTPNPRGEVLHKLELALRLPPETLLAYARGDIDDEELQQVTGIAQPVLPAWVRRDAVEKVNVPNRVTVLLLALEAATVEDQEKAIEAAMQHLSGDDG